MTPEEEEEAPGEDEEDEETAAAEDEEGDETWVRPIDKFKRSTAGSVVAAGLLGLRDAMEGRPKKEEAAIVSEAPTAPHTGNIELVLDPEHPERSVVYVHKPPEDDAPDV